jgi:hypothetical protein
MANPGFNFVLPEEHKRAVAKHWWARVEAGVRHAL